MKKSFAIAVFMIVNTLIVHHVIAKNQKGVYLTAKDYQDKKVSYSTSAKIHLNNSVLELPYITVVDSNKTIKLNKANVFAYAGSNNKVYRFYNNTEYMIAASGPITIYIQYEHVAQSKGYNVKQNYYFSSSLDGQLIPLTLNNVKQAYSGNNQFVDLLDHYFSNGDVVAFDATHNMYKLNYVYSKSQK